MLQISSNPYLEVRCAYAFSGTALIAARDGGDEAITTAEGAVLNAIWDAEALGRADAIAARAAGADVETAGSFEEVPAFFADVPDLSNAWMNGWVAQWEFFAMLRCPGCQNEHGHPCAAHG
ncbi:hypothetical protein [Burkholderia plantarii]|uniref:hypothetical protein n=1 Tax=Burkholderia plantarii TaxID=41899 RepID=UPI0006D8A462|nr:hypothetical protein [Burkholderia plantarii]ALK35211.1 hypothetical protein bpln_1p0650 [Burkholderia plantarii]GLZ23124.1 hypothetical protein Bpla01_66520 [Burkholderia plantarii]